jgi:murein L,D-transpeptidase YcbB/YkuD
MGLAVQTCAIASARNLGGSSPTRLGATLVCCGLPFRTITLTVALFAAGILIAQETPAAKTKPAASKSRSRKKSAHKATTAGTGSSAKTTAKSGTTPVSHGRSAKSSKSKTSVAVSRRSFQQQPTQERYKEIQQALADRGYFNGQADGTWGPESVDALKRFQREQNLTDDGKLGSLSLIALGLGPKRAEPVDKTAQR